MVHVVSGGLFIGRKSEVPLCWMLDHVMLLSDADADRFHVNAQTWVMADEDAGGRTAM